jgi:cytochrome c
MYRNIVVKHVVQALAVAVTLLTALGAGAAADVEAAKGLARQNSCFACHSVDKVKEGPTFKKVAEKYRGKADAEATLLALLTAGSKVKFPDGHEEAHKVIKSSDKAAIKNLADWILEQ